MIPISRPTIGREERDAVERILASGNLVAGEEVPSFEAEFAEYIGVNHAVAVGSGTAGLHIGLLSLGIGPGDEVILPSFTFAATANAVSLCGADPVFVDVDPMSFCIDPKAAEGALTERTAAVLPVHLFGHPAAMGVLMSLAAKAGIAVVEDAAQAHGAALSGRKVGSFGSFGVFSFYPSKNMTTGEGGMITTDDGELADRARLLRNQGMRERYRHEVVGLNERMTEIEAAIGRVQLFRLDDWNAHRRRNAARYVENLASSYVTPQVAPGATHVYHQFTVRVDNRGSATAALENAEIGYGIYYPTPTHKQPPYVSREVSLPVTESLADEVLSLPVGPHCGDADIDLIAKVMNEAVSHV